METGRGGGGRARALQVLTNPNRFPAAQRIALADALERLALTSEFGLVRRNAAAYILLAGLPSRTHPLPSAPARIIRIYERSDDPTVQGMLLARIWEIADHAAVTGFLRRLAMQEEPDAWGSHMEASPATAAVAALARMGPEGRSVLRELHRARSVRSLQAKHYLDQLAERDFVPDNGGARQ